MTRGAPTIHPTVLLMACVHMMVDGYGNIYAPLLPLLIPRLDLSLAAAGTLTMLFQLSASVAQIGFGHLADRWHPRLLVMIGPIVAVSILSFVGTATSPLMLGAILVVGGLGGAAFHPPAAALAHRLGGARPGFSMSVYITGGTLGFSLGPLLFAPFAERFGLTWTPLLALPGLAVVAFFVRRVPAIPVHTAGGSGFRALRPYARPLALLYFIVVLRTLAAISFATFLPVMLTRRGLSLAASGTAVAGYLFASGLGGFFGGPAADRFGPKKGHRPVARARGAVPVRRADADRLAVPDRGGDWRVLPAVHPSGERHIRPGDRAGQRRDCVFADDGVRLGDGRAERADRRANCRPDRDRGRRCAGLALVPLAAAACALPLPSRAHLAAPARPSRPRCAGTLMVG